MLPVLLAVGLVAGVVALAIKKTMEPSKTPAAEKAKLVELKLKTKLTLDEAEDGRVLARRYGERAAELHFETAVNRLRKLRPPI